ncbi:MAG: NBR1-Ig-like domain-containing protein [bacterium]
MARATVLLLAVVSLLPAPTPARADSVIIGPGRFPRLRNDSAGRLHLMYQESGAVHYRSFDGVWSAPEQLPGSAGVNMNKWGRHRMHVTPTGGLVYASWGFGYDTDVYFALRDPGGWQGPELACANTVRPWEYAAVAAQTTGDAYVFCQVDDLWVAHRSPTGTWDAPTLLWQPGAGTAKHVVARTDGSDVVHVSFRIGAVQYLHSAGSAWSPLYSLVTAGSAEQPAFLIDAADRLHLTWQDWLNQGGGSWVPETVRYATGADDQWSGGNAGEVVHTYGGEANPPEVAVDSDDTIVVTWIEGSQLLSATSPGGGAPFGAPAVLATDARPVQAGNLEQDLRTPPAVFVANRLHLVYENDAGQLVHEFETLPENDARFVSQTVPTAVAADTSFQVELTFENTGSSAWTAAAGYALGSQNPPDNDTWSSSRLTLPGAITVPSGTQHTFTATLTAPAATGAYDFQWRMIHDPGEWFGESSANLTITVVSVAVDGGPAPDAQPGDASLADADHEPPPGATSGCDCATPGSAAPPWLLLVVLLGTLFRNRRRPPPGAGPRPRRARRLPPRASTRPARRRGG